MLVSVQVCLVSVSVAFAVVGRHWRKMFFLEEKQIIARALFEEYDRDGGGKLDVEEVHALCRRLGRKMPIHQVERLVRRLDDSGDMQLDAKEFTHWWVNEGGKGVKIPPDIPRDAHAMGDAYYSMEIGCYVELLTYAFGLLLYAGKYADDDSVMATLFGNETFSNLGGSGVLLSTSSYSLWCLSLGARDELEAQKAEKRAVAQILFREYDSDGTGKLDFKEVSQLCERLGRKLSDQEIRKMLRKVGGEDMEIDSDEFVGWCVSFRPRYCVLCEYVWQGQWMRSVLVRVGGWRTAVVKCRFQTTSRTLPTVQETVYHQIAGIPSAKRWISELMTKCGGSRRMLTFRLALLERL